MTSVERPSDEFLFRRKVFLHWRNWRKCQEWMNTGGHFDKEQINFYFSKANSAHRLVVLENFGLVGTKNHCFEGMLDNMENVD